MKSLKIIFLFVLANLFAFHSFAQKSTDEDLANQYFSDKEYDKAVIYFEKLHNKNDNPLFYNRLLNCYIELQEFKNAEKLVKRQIKNNPFEVAYNADLAHVYKVEGKENEARQTAEKTIKELIPNQQLIQELAMAFLRYQELDDAKETYLQGRKILKGTYPFNFELAQIYNLQGKTEAMLNEYLEALVFQESFIQSVQNALQTVLYPDEDGSKKSLLKTLLLKNIQKYPDKKVFSEMLIWVYIQEENFNGAFIQAKALDKRFKEYGQRLTALAELCLENKDYETAVKCYQYVIEKGPDNFYYISAKMELVNVYNQKIVNEKNYTEQDLLQLENTYLSTLNELGRTATTSPLLRGLARLYAFYLHQPQKAIDMLTEAKEMGGMKPQDIAQIKIDLADVYLFVDEIWEASLLYSQVEKEFKYDQLGETAKFKNAKISFYTGDFAWSKAQLDVLKASTSKLIANDAMQLSILITDNIGIDTTQAPLLIYAKADLLAYQNKQIEAMKLLDSLAETFPIHTINDDILYKKYEINYHLKNNAAAIENLQKIIDNYAYDILADDAIYHLALIYDYEQNDKEKAKELYKKLLFEHQDSVYGVDARKRYRELQTGVNIININEDKLEFEAN
ncbi:MAG: tetratricopeptide repeat protein [Flavobacteriales bacterium]|nr:tetratricopeptide repeat protein [Flavobacteriales bacterium]MCB9335931.1 tetratricopeptide repeat protein [Flavobacteriales bacterium]